MRIAVSSGLLMHIMSGFTCVRLSADNCIDQLPFNKKEIKTNLDFSFFTIIMKYCRIRWTCRRWDWLIHNSNKFVQARVPFTAMNIWCRFIIHFEICLISFHCIKKFLIDTRNFKNNKLYVHKLCNKTKSFLLSQYFLSISSFERYPYLDHTNSDDVSCSFSCSIQLRWKDCWDMKQDVLCLNSSVVWLALFAYIIYIL